MKPSPRSDVGRSAPAPGFSAVIIAPTYNNAGTVIGVLARALALGLPLIVVDDGSTDGTEGLLRSWVASERSRRNVDRGVSPLLTLRHPRNMGKARALLTGFGAAAERGHTHAVTIDTDGQLDPESVPALLEVAVAAPRALVLGVRAERIDGCPARSLLGRRLSNLAIRRECGLILRDSQCGLRVYPLALVTGPGSPRWRAGRFAFEAEVVTRAAWAGRPVLETPVACRYFPTPARVSHFKPFRDTAQGVALHARLLVTALTPWGGGARAGVRVSEIKRRGRWRLRGSMRRARSWISPSRLWRQVRSQRAGRTEAALGVSVGVFIANLPVYGAQTLLSLYVARRLHLHPLAVLAGAQVSTPPVGVVLIAAAVAVGHAVLHGTWIWTGVGGGGLPPEWNDGWSFAGSVLADWAVGSVVVGAVTAAAAFGATWGVLRLAAHGEGSAPVTEVSTSASKVRTVDGHGAAQQAPFEP